MPNVEQSVVQASQDAAAAQMAKNGPPSMGTGMPADADTDTAPVAAPPPPPGFTPVTAVGTAPPPPPGFTPVALPPPAGATDAGSHTGDYVSAAYHREHPHEKAPIINPAAAGQSLTGENLTYKTPISQLPGETVDDTMKRAAHTHPSAQAIKDEQAFDAQNAPVVIAATGAPIRYAALKVLAKAKQAIFGGDQQILGHPEDLMSDQFQKDHPYAAHFAKAIGAFSTPETVAMGAGLGTKGVPIAERMMQSGFATSMLSDLSDKAPEFKDVMMGTGKYADMSADDRESVAKGMFFDMTIDAGMATAAAEHAATGEAKAATKFGAAADKVVGETTAKAAQKAKDKANTVLGKTDNFNTAFMRMAPGGGGKARATFRQQVEAVSPDLQAVVNANKDTIKSPGTAADALQEHLNKQTDALVDAAGGARDTALPVVTDSFKRANDAMDKFFDDNKGRYGSPEAVEKAKQAVRDRWMQEKNVDEPGDPKERREPNLWEMENVRRGLNDATKGPIGMPEGAGEAAARVAAGEARSQIDESFAVNGVGNVAEYRASQARIIDIINRLRSAEEAAKAAGTPGILNHLFSAVGSTSGIVAIALGHPVGAAAIGVGALADYIHSNVKNPNFNAERTVELAGRSPEAQAQVVTPTIPDPARPTFGPPVEPPFGPQMPEAPFNPDLHAELASYYHSTIDKTNGAELKEKFLDSQRKQVADATAQGRQFFPTDQERDLLYTINKADAKTRQQTYDKALKQAEDDKAAAEQAAEERKKAIAEQKTAADKAVLEQAAKEKQVAADKKAAHDALIADENVAHSPVMKATEPAMEINGVEGRTSPQNHGHENGHILANVAEELEPFNFLSEHHADAKKNNAAASVQTDVSGAKPGMEGLEQRVVGILGGPAFDEVHGDLPLNRNTGAGSDISRARQILREEGGLKGDELNKVFDALYERAKGHVSNPEALALVQANAPLREKGLHSDYHMSPGRLAEYVKKLKGVYNGKTPTTAGIHEGGSDGGVLEGEQAGAGGEGKEQDGLPAKVPAEETRKNDAGGEEQGNEGTETSAVSKTPEQQHKQKFSLDVTENGETRVEPVEAFSRKEAFKIAQKKFPGATEFNLAAEDGEDLPREEGYVVPTGKHLNTPDSRTGTQPVEKTMNHELGHYMVGHNEGLSAKGVLRHTAPGMLRNANAAVEWDTSDLKDASGRKFKADKIPGMIRMTMGGIAQDELGGLPRGINNNFDIKAGGDATQGMKLLHMLGFQDQNMMMSMLHDAVDQAKTHLTNKHVSDIINENAGVREKGLSKQYHYSGDRLRAMGDEATRRIENEKVNDNGRTDGRGDEAGGADVGGREGQAAGPNDQRVQNKGIEQSNIDHDEVLANIKRAYGVHDDPKLERAGKGFITPEGKFIDLPGDHTDAIEWHGGGPAQPGPDNVDNRKAFINDTNTIRVNKSRERGGQVVSFSVPEGGVSDAQASAMERSFGANGDRNGILRMERADISPETRNTLSTEKEFPSASDVKPMLQKIQALEQSNVNKTDQVAAHEANGGSTFTPEGENLAGKDLYSVGAHPDRTLSVDKLTPEVLAKFKADNADLLSQGDRAVGTWKDPDTGKSVLDITKLHTDRDAAVAAGQDANQKAIYHLGSGETIPTGGTGEGTGGEDFNFGKNAEGTEDQQKGIISTAVPTGTKAIADPHTENVHVGMQSVTPEAAVKIANKIREMPGMRIPEGLKDPQKVISKYIDQFKNNLKDLYNQVPKETRDATAKWYESANKIGDRIASKYGKSAKQGAGVLAAMSPQKDWNMNVGLAERTMDIYHQHADDSLAPEARKKAGEIGLGGMAAAIGDRTLNQLTEPLEKAAFIRIWDETHNDRSFKYVDPGTGDYTHTMTNNDGSNSKIAWGALNEIAKGVNILDDGSRENISRNLGGSHKVRNFYNNIVDPNNPGGHVTIDTHAVAAGHQRPLSGKDPEVLDNFGRLSVAATGLKGTYAVHAEAYRQAAAELGIQPRQLQSITWEQVRKNFPAELKSSPAHRAAIDDIWGKYKDGKITQSQAQQQVSAYAKTAREQIAENAEKPKTPKLEPDTFDFGGNTQKSGVANLGDMPVLKSKYLNLHGAK